MTGRILLWFFALAMAAPALAAGEKPLFSSDEVIQVTITGPLSSIARSRSENPQPGALAVAGQPAMPISLSARGITR